MNHDISFYNFMTLCVPALLLILESSCNCLQIKILQMQVYFPLGALQ